MTFFHELSHALLNTEDPPDGAPLSNIGTAVRFCNKIRKQMGKDYGKRVSYVCPTKDAWYEEGKGYAAYYLMSKQSRKDVRKGNKPTGYYARFYYQIK